MFFRYIEIDMIPGNVDPRRPEKVQRYKPPQANGNAPVEDLTPDYMNILGEFPLNSFIVYLRKSLTSTHSKVVDCFLQMQCPHIENIVEDY